MIIARWLLVLQYCAPQLWVVVALSFFLLTPQGQAPKYAQQL